VIASHSGALANSIQDGKTGLLFDSGNAQDLVEKLIWANQNPVEMARMGQSARAEYLENILQKQIMFY